MGIRKPVFVESTVTDPCRYCGAGRPNSGSLHGCTLLFLSRIDKKKGAYETVDAYRMLKKRYPELSLVIAGDGVELPRLRQYVDSHRIDGVSFLGKVSGKAKHDTFELANIYVLPTTYREGMPIAVLEAMAHGLP